MNSADRALVAALQRREADWIGFLGELVNCDSGTFDKREVDRVGKILADAINGLGFTTERVPQEQFGDHLIARKPGRGDQRLLFIGHFDTVFPRGTAAARPFTITDDRATGPGVYDMKSGLVVLFAALTALRDAGAQVWDDAPSPRSSIAIMNCSSVGFKTQVVSSAWTLKTS